MNMIKKTIFSYVKSLKKIRASIYFLIGANVVPLVGTVFFDWDIIHLLYLYWLESCIIGFFNLAKIITAKIDFTFQQVYLKIFATIFFCIHYPAMMWVLMEAGINLIAKLVFNRPLTLEMSIKYTWSAMLSLFLSHGYSFYKNYIKDKEREQARVMKLLYMPYFRIGAMWVVLMGGLYFILKHKQPVFLIVILVILKIIADCFSHLKERKRIVT